MKLSKGALKAATFVFGLVLFASAQAQTIRWEPGFRFPGTFFPAFAISAAGRDGGTAKGTAALYGFPESSSLFVRVFDVPVGAKVRVEIEVPEIGVSGAIDTPAWPDGQPKAIIPRLAWSQQRLASISQPISTEVIFRVFVNGESAGEKRRPIRVRAINDAPIKACRTPQDCTDYSVYMAAFVNENHPVIDNILRDALNIPAMPVKQWVGTQNGEDYTLKQVWAIWYWLQRNRVTYSSITTDSDNRQDLFSQTVRPLSQTLRTQQANCIDGTALFASILRKIGIEPTIVLIPGHAFLGFATDPQQRKLAFLETTMLNAATNPFNQQGPTKTGTALGKVLGMDIHMNRSWNTFVDAINEGSREYNAAALSFSTHQQGYLLVPIAKAREAGVLPLPL